MLDPAWEPTLADRAEHFRPSPVRAVFEIAMRPDVVSLAGGDPDTSLLPHDHIGDLAQKLVATRGTEILGYGSGAGLPALKERSAQLMAAGGADIDPSRIQISTGSQMGIHVTTELLCNKGDVILAEGPTYVGILGTFGSFEIEVQQVPIDADGLDPEHVAERIDDLQRQGRRVRFLYTIANYQNPTGATLAEDRRARLVEVCVSRGVLILEDDAYGFLGFDRTRHPTSLASIDPDHVFSAGSYSKLFSPGLRCGWLALPGTLQGQAQLACEAITVTPNVLAQEICAAYVGTDLWRERLDRQVARYEERCTATIAALDEQLRPLGASWTRPKGGFFVWVDLPDEFKGVDLLAAALQEKVVIIPGLSGWVQEPPRVSLRIAFSNTAPDVITDGVERLGRALRAAIG